MSMLKVAGGARKCRLFQAVAGVVLAVGLFSCAKEEEPPPEPVTLESIEVTTLPVKKTYPVGQEFEPEGMVVMATYSDDSTAAIDIAQATFVFDFSSTGEKTIDVAYEGKATSFGGITVREVASISLELPPAKTTYAMGEAFNPADMVVLANLDDLFTASLALSTLEFDYDFSETGTELTLTIRYGDQTTTFDGITVVPFAGGGIDGDPFLIGTAAQLAKLAELTKPGNDEYRDKFYKLTAEIDLSAYGKDSDFNEGKGWIPIGYFSGNFDGGDHTVSGLYINNYTMDFAGLFMFLEDGAIITNLAIADADITARNTVGGIAGVVQYSNLTNCYVTGTVSGDTHYVGGIAGLVEYSNVTNCEAKVSVSGNSYVEYVGGIAGIVQYSSITNCYAEGSVSGNHIVGGVVGSVYGNSSITNSSATVSVSSNNYVGGIAGRVNDGSNITNAHAETVVSGNNYVGGVAGTVNGNSSITNAYAEAVVSGNDYVGGIAGSVSNSSNITNAYAEAVVSGNDYVGGVAGSVGGDSSIITNCYAAGSASGNNHVGGVAGRTGLGGNVTSSYASGVVSGNSSVGGVAGSTFGGSLTHSIALNPSIMRTGGSATTFGRVAGSNMSVLAGTIVLSGTLELNSAWEGMEAAGGIGFNTLKEPNTTSGVDFPTAGAKHLPIYTTGFDFGDFSLVPEVPDHLK